MAKYCLIGRSLRHSLSPQIYKAFGVEDYSLVELADPLALHEFIKKNIYKGFNVTIPYKQTIMQYLRWISPEARAIGAVNTVVRKIDELYGYNTDILGMEYALESVGIDLKEKVIAILGSGGTSKTAEFLAKKNNAKEVIIVSRHGSIDYDNVYANKDIEIIINTTPIGMYPDGSGIPIDISRFPNIKGVYDVVYNPITTNLVREARIRNISAANGLSMLVEQARQAMRIYGEKVPEKNITEKVLNELKKDMCNIVLIGMPGSGKSAVGKALAEEMKRPLFDTDEEVVKLEGISVPDIFKTKGETYFRDSESKVIEKISNLSGSIISLGGGAVLREENRNALARNGIMVYLKRDLSLLETKGRPLSEGISLERMAKIREPIYEEFADYIVENNTALKKVAQSIYREYVEMFSWDERDSEDGEL